MSKVSRKRTIRNGMLWRSSNSICSDYSKIIAYVSASDQRVDRKICSEGTQEYARSSTLSKYCRNLTYSLYLQKKAILILSGERCWLKKAKIISMKFILLIPSQKTPICPHLTMILMQTAFKKWATFAEIIKVCKNKFQCKVTINWTYRE